ncbi:MAG: 4-hydroxyphenylacetate 3-hydroxylase family protein [Anaerolineae bacterium]
MALKSFDEHCENLRDGREVYYAGQRVEDVTTHPVLGIGMAHAAIDYTLAQDTEHRDLATYTDPDTGEVYSRYYKIPQSADDLLKRRELIAAGTRAGKGVVLLIKEIGTDALFALHIVTHHLDEHRGTDYLPRVREFYQYCRDRDLSHAVAQTDVKGDRGKRPSEQPHPDYYLRVVERRDDGIVVRGAKAHTTASPFVDELIVLPTRAMTEVDADYAVSFAVPVNTPGVKLIADPSSDVVNDPFSYPVSSEHKMVDTLTIFDDVFVPWERVFLCGEWEYAGALANTFVQFHRFTAIAYKLPMCELFVGGAALMAEYNGIAGASHVREKVMELIAWTETTRGLAVAAAVEHDTVPPGIAVPNTTLTNIAKYHFARNYHMMAQNVQDIAGGLIVTGPSTADWDNPATRPYLERYLGGAEEVSAETRLRLMNLLHDIAASGFGGYQEVLAIHAEGSLAAQRITVVREYDVERCVELAKEAAHIDGE